MSAMSFPATLQHLIIHYGYWALFIGTFLEGETILIVAGFLAFDGYLKLPWVILSAFLGTFAGDQTFFFLGRIKGISFLERHKTWKRKSERTFALLQRHQVLIILGFRFIYGIRNVTPFVIGASGLRPLRFFVLNFLGALTWAFSFAFLGYGLGTLTESIFNKVHKYEMLILEILLLIGLISFLISNRRRK
jgi:membrane protein DedA with SNARE-associated domain